jgi:hypothetical protein
MDATGMNPFDDFVLGDREDAWRNFTGVEKTAAHVVKDAEPVVEMTSEDVYEELHKIAMTGYAAEMASLLASLDGQEKVATEVEFTASHGELADEGKLGAFAADWLQGHLGSDIFKIAGAFDQAVHAVARQLPLDSDLEKTASAGEYMPHALAMALYHPDARALVKEAVSLKGVGKLFGKGVKPPHLSLPPVPEGAAAYTSRLPRATKGPLKETIDEAALRGQGPAPHLPAQPTAVGAAKIKFPAWDIRDVAHGSPLSLKPAPPVKKVEVPTAGPATAKAPTAGPSPVRPGAHSDARPSMDMGPRPAGSGAAAKVEVDAGSGASKAKSPKETKVDTAAAAAEGEAAAMGAAGPTPKPAGAGGGIRPDGGGGRPDGGGIRPDGGGGRPDGGGIRPDGGGAGAPPRGPAPGPETISPSAGRTGPSVADGAEAAASSRPGGPVSTWLGEHLPGAGAVGRSVGRHTNVATNAHADDLGTGFAAGAKNKAAASARVARQVQMAPDEAAKAEILRKVKAAGGEVEYLRYEKELARLKAGGKPNPNPGGRGEQFAQQEHGAYGKTPAGKYESELKKLEGRGWTRTEDGTVIDATGKPVAHLDEATGKLSRVDENGLPVSGGGKGGKNGTSTSGGKNGTSTSFGDWFESLPKWQQYGIGGGAMLGGAKVLDLGEN